MLVRLKRTRAGGFFTFWGRTALAAQEICSSVNCTRTKVAGPVIRPISMIPTNRARPRTSWNWRFKPSNGFGTQLWYTVNGETAAHVTRHGDTFAFSTGYHPTVTSPGHESYIFTILVGKTQRSLIQNFDSSYLYLMDRIPGIAAMREKFK